MFVGVLQTRFTNSARFMEGLQWVDKTYVEKHQADDPKSLRAMYYPNLMQHTSSLPPKTKSLKTSPWDGGTQFLNRYIRRAIISLTMLLLSHVPYFGKFILPAISFYTFDKKVGNKPAVIIFASGLFVPRKYFVIFLQTYFSSRSMVTELVSLSAIRNIILTNLYSSNHTSAESTSQRHKRNNGSSTAKASSSASALPSSCSLRYPSSAS